MIGVDWMAPSESERIYVVDKTRRMRHGPMPLVLYRQGRTSMYTNDPLGWVFYENVMMFEPKAGCLDA